jgi:hypothetical protein
MKFLLIVRFLMEVITKKDKTVMKEDEELINARIYHPSEFQLR